jgi:ABC-2 type transport system ATP-binding protein
MPPSTGSSGAAPPPALSPSPGGAPTPPALSPSPGGPSPATRATATAPTRTTGDRTPDGAPGGDEVIVTEGLTKLYPPDIRAVDDLDLSVRRGEIFGLLGPNGAGKTTTAGMLTTRVIPTSGRAFVGGIDVIRHPALAKQVIGVVPQTNTLDRSLTVWENLYFHGRYFGMGAVAARSTADRLLTQFRLSERAKAPVMALSGGMAQRLMVARAIFHHPDILFLDEPTAGLDPQSRIAMWEILGELHQEGQTILLTTHYMEEADELCDRLAIMDHGRILALDTPAGLKQSVGADSIVVVDATGDLDHLARLLTTSIDAVAAASIVDGRIRLAVAGATTGVLPEIVTTAEHGGCTVTNLSVREPSLETVFINLTGKELRD